MILLDTHVLIWLAEDLPRLGPQSRARLRRAGQVHFSSVSITEIAVKSMIGKLSYPADLVQRLAEQGLRELPFLAGHAEAVLRFPALARHEPFDRMLLAQAAEEGATFLTVDRALLDLGLDWVADASV